jgi:hypothetical protein
MLQERIRNKSYWAIGLTKWVIANKVRIDTAMQYFLDFYWPVQVRGTKSQSKPTQMRDENETMYS